MRLGGWQRIGVVASILWVFADAFMGSQAALDEAGARTSSQLNSCVAPNRMRLSEHGPYDQVWTPCWKQHNANFVRNAEGHWWVALAVVLIPIPVGGLLGWMLISTVTRRLKLTGDAAWDRWVADAAMV